LASRSPWDREGSRTGLTGDLATEGKESRSQPAPPAVRLRSNPLISYFDLKKDDG